MSGSDDDVDRLVAAASRALANTRYCWLATPSAAGAVNARPMGRTPQGADDDWIVRFMTDPRSRKVAEIGLSGRVAAMIVQRDAEDAYLSLLGAAVVLPRGCEDARLWRDIAAVGEERRAALIEVRVDRMELWMRGVTPEPFGFCPTALARDGAGAWRQVD